eukprot:gene3139-3925_t
MIDSPFSIRLNGISASLGGWFGFSTSSEYLDKAYSQQSTRSNNEPITTFNDALDWYQNYYLHPDPENFLTAITILLGKESHLFVHQQLQSVRADRDMKSIARLQSIQSFYYLPLIGFMATIIKQHPDKAQQWYNQLMSNPEMTQKYQSTFGELDIAMLVNLAFCLNDDDQSKKIKEQIVTKSLKQRSESELTPENFKSSLENLNSWVNSQKTSMPSYPLLLIGEYFAVGDSNIVKRICAIWRKSLDSLEKMGSSSTATANTANNINKRLEFEYREMIIVELNQAIRLLCKDQKAIKILKEEMSHHVKSKEERNKQYQ